MTTPLFDERSAKVKEHERRAAVILDGMYQFVALLNPSGDILEVNRAALEGAGHQIQEIRGMPFWTARWWQISEQTQEDLQVAIRRAAAGEFVRYEVDIYGEQSGRVPITIDFSLQPIPGASGYSRWAGGETATSWSCLSSPSVNGRRSTTPAGSACGASCCIPATPSATAPRTTARSRSMR